MFQLFDFKRLFQRWWFRQWRRQLWRDGLNKPLYIFDLDGTLALIEHRRVILDDWSDKNRWRRFYALCDKDQPNVSVIQTLEVLRRSGAEIWIFSGRSDEVRDKTITWLMDYTSLTETDMQTALTMRRESDYTPDDILKQRWFNSMLEDDQRRLVAVFDDRDRVVEMRRKNGVTCFQVAPGAF